MSAKRLRRLIGALAIVGLVGACWGARAQENAAKDARAGLAGSLERELLKMGLEFRVSAQGKGSEKLLMLGYPVDRTIIFRLISYGKVMEHAQAKGFKTVEIVNMLGPGSRWTFDLSGAGPAPKCSVTGPMICGE